MQWLLVSLANLYTNRIADVPKVRFIQVQYSNLKIVKLFVDKEKNLKYNLRALTK